MPESILHYEIEKKLGEGGMGRVYLARDTKLKRKVALKFLSRQESLNPIQRKRLEQEAQAVASLSHSNIAQVYAIEEVDDESFIVMEYVEGINLKEAIEAGKLTLQEKSAIAIHVAKGIKSAHDKGIIHRDIKSGNIMVDSEGRVKVMDFGLARILETDHITKTGSTVGTTVYMAPEQLAGKEANFRSDIWSYGVVLYELFTGELPFKGEYEQAVMYSITEEEPILPSEIAPEIPERVEHVIHRCLGKNPASRYQTFSDLLGDLNGEKPLSQTAPKFYRISRSTYIYAGIFAVVLFGALAFFSEFNIPRPAIVVPDKRYLAVLPIENIGGGPGLQAICDGLAETFSYKLSELEKYEDTYWVAPAGELRKEQINTVTQAKNKLGINLAILSSIQTMKDSTRLILELVDANNMRRLETEQVMVPAGHFASLEQNGIEAMMGMLHLGMDSGINKSLNNTHPTDPKAYEYYLKGMANLQDAAILDSLDNAIDFFGQAIEADSEFALGYAGLGESYWRKYETTQDVSFVNKADSALNQALELNKKLPQVQTLLGIIHTGTGKYEEANYHFRRALEIDPKHTSAYSGLAKAYNMQGETQKAETTYRRAIELKPYYWGGYNDLGYFHLTNGNYAEAAKQFKKVIEITPHNSSGYSNLGVVYYNKGDIGKAQRMFETSLALENNPLTANNLAAIYYEEEMFEEATRVYELALESMPNRYDLWGNLALSYLKGGDKKKAVETYHIAIEKAQDQLEVNPNNAELLADIGNYYSEVGDTSSAVEYINDALKINSEDIRIRHQAVVVYEKSGMREKAIRLIDVTMIPEIEYQAELEGLVADPRYLDWKAKVSN